VRRVVLVAVALVLLLAAADAVVIVASRPDEGEDDASSATVAAVFDTDPNAGENASCRFDPGPGLVLLDAGYDCVALVCGEEFARVRVTHSLIGGWSYRVTSGGRIGTRASGHTAPGPVGDSEPCTH
jgi:hypothetical protein